MSLNHTFGPWLQHRAGNTGACHDAGAISCCSLLVLSRRGHDLEATSTTSDQALNLEDTS